MSQSVSQTLREFTPSEVQSHNTEEDCWVIIDGYVYDLSKFHRMHPGGSGVITREAGKDVTKLFYANHSSAVMPKYHSKLVVGRLSTTSPKCVSSVEKREAQLATYHASNGTFGEMIPYGDPAWYQGWVSPYYNDSHRRFRAAVREFVERELVPNVQRWDEAKKLPKEIHRKCFEAGWLPGVVGHHWPTEYAGDKIAGGVRPEEYDAFHELIIMDEVSRCASGGVTWGLFEGLQIGLPPVLRFAKPAVRDRVCRETLRGEKVICLAITEPYAGSDVAGLRCTAKLSADKTHYIVNGEKKWITNGVFADYFTTAVRTGDEGKGGVSLLLISRDMGGVTTHQMQCGGVWASGTAYITFENVKVPVENLIGVEDQGFKCIMHNFNHERWGVTAQCIRFARVCLEESIRWSQKRVTFGVPMIEHGIIRAKLAEMARQIEATQAQLELVTMQINVLPEEKQPLVLGGPIALLKAQATKTFELCAREAVQIMGGTGYTRTGQGSKVERLYREVRAYAIPAGSEEIMLDLGIKQALKYTAKL